MIPMCPRDRCTILRRQNTGEYGGTAADQYDVYAENLPCHFVEKEGRMERQNEQGRNTIYTGVVLLDEQILETDLIDISSIRYRILRAQPIRDFVTGAIAYYRGYLEREQAVDVDTINAEPVINL